MPRTGSTGDELLRRLIEQRARVEEALERTQARARRCKNRLAGHDARRLSRTLASWAAPLPVAARRLRSARGNVLARDARRLVTLAEASPDQAALRVERARLASALRALEVEQRRADRLEWTVRLRERGALALLPRSRRFRPRAPAAGPSRRRPRPMFHWRAAEQPARSAAVTAVVYGPAVGVMRTAVSLRRRAGGSAPQLILLPGSRALDPDLLGRALRRATGSLVLLTGPASVTEAGALARAAAPLTDDSDIDAICLGPEDRASAPLAFDWEEGAPSVTRLTPPSEHGPHPAALACGPLLMRREVARALTRSGRPGCLDGIGLSLALSTGGWKLGWMRVPGVRRTDDEPSIGNALEHWGPAVRRAVMRDLAAGGGVWCKRALRVRLAAGDALERECKALRWSVAEAGQPSDVALERAGDRLLVDFLMQTEGFAAEVALDSADGGEEDQIQAALARSIERPLVCFELGARSREVARTWGDYHLATAVGRALGRGGLGALVSVGSERGLPGAACVDVVVALRGRPVREPRPGQLTLAWHLSHPDSTPDAELELYDRVLVASREHAARLRARLTVDTTELLQCTDTERFRPVPGTGERYELLFVGNWRSVFRRVVFDALSTGRDVALVGRGWHRLAPATVVAESVPNERLPELYSSCDVLLNDHWDDMRANGFISNRVFDALACGAFVISDHMEALTQEFPGGLETYTGAQDLDGKLERYLASPAERRAVAERGRELVAGRHDAGTRSRELQHEIAAAALACTRPALTHLHPWAEGLIDRDDGPRSADTGQPASGDPAAGSRRTRAG